MNTHDKINELLAGFALGELSEQESSKVERHLAECEQCRSELKELKAVLECTKAMRGLSADEQVCESVKQALFAAADEEITKPAPAGLESLWRIIMAAKRLKLAAAAILIAGVAFLGGQLSVPPTLPTSVNVAGQVGAEPDGVNVPSELVAWLEAARLFRQLGMEDRMARAVERAGRLLPADTFIADGQTEKVFAAARSIENQTERLEPMGMSGPHPSAESVNQILAQFFGD